MQLRISNVTLAITTPFFGCSQTTLVQSFLRTGIHRPRIALSFISKQASCLISPPLSSHFEIMHIFLSTPSLISVLLIVSSFRKCYDDVDTYYTVDTNKPFKVLSKVKQFFVILPLYSCCWLRVFGIRCFTDV